MAEFFLAILDFITEGQASHDGIEWLVKAADDHDAGAEYFLGMRLLANDSEAKNLNQSFIHLKASAEQKNRDAELVIGFMYYYGTIGSEN